jgi:hypothetical protein
MNRQNSKSERGMALVVCLLALLLLSGIGIALLSTADYETQINDNYRTSQQSHFSAIAGPEEVRDRMRSAHPQRIAEPTLMPGTGAGSIIYVRNPRLLPSGATEAISPANAANPYFDTELCHENFQALALPNPGPNVRCTTMAPATQIQFVNSIAPFTNQTGALDFKWTRITKKANNSTAPHCVTGDCNVNPNTEVCWDPVLRRQVLLTAGFANCIAANYQPVYLLTTLAVTPRGARRMVQAEVTRFTMPPLPAALTLDGPAPAYTAPDSNPFRVEGNDHGTCGNLQAPKPAIGVVDDASDLSVTAAIPANRLDHYTGSGMWPDVQNISSTVNETYTDPAKLEELVNLIAASANQTLPSGLFNPPIGTDANPLVTVVNGDLTLDDIAGAGVLIVTGTLTTSGNTSFKGLLLVVGQGSWNFAGGGNGQITGGVIVAKTRDASGNLLGTLGQPTLNWAGGGGNGIRYDSCWINRVQNYNFRAIAFRELAY